MATNHRPALRLGTRGSALALTQSGLIADALRAYGADVEMIVIRTAGDDRPSDTVWGEGAFVMALERALLDRRIDLAVHSAKDVPTAADPRLVIAAYPVREDPRDALVCRDPAHTLATLPPGALVGTDSPRRVAFLRARRPDLRTRPLHGNVDTRLRKLADGEADALVLAVAGLARLGLAGRITEILAPEVALPAPGQGALAVEVRADDPVARPLVARLDDPATRGAVEAERAVLRASGGGCRAPLGALAVVEGETIVIRGAAAAADAVPAGDAPATEAALALGTTFTAAGGPVEGGACEAPLPPFVARAARRGLVQRRLALAVDLAADLARLLAASAPPAQASAAPAGPGPAAPGSGAPRSGPLPRVLVTREPGHPGALAAGLAARGLDPLVVPTIELRPAAPGGPLDDAVANAGAYDWLVVTSAAGATAVAAAAQRVGTDLAPARFAAVGGATAACLASHGGTAAFVASRAVGAILAAELPLVVGQRVLVARADAADDALPARLRDRGARVDDVVAYHTVEGPEAARGPLQAAFDADPPSAIIFTSGSTVRGLLALLGPAERRAALGCPACCIGPSTAAVARDLGFATVVEAGEPSTDALVDLVAAVVAASPATTVLPVVAASPGVTGRPVVAAPPASPGALAPNASKDPR